jgi:hypothetical protein
MSEAKDTVEGFFTKDDLLYDTENFWNELNLD